MPHLDNRHWSLFLALMGCALLTTHLAAAAGLGNKPTGPAQPGQPPAAATHFNVARSTLIASAKPPVVDAAKDPDFAFQGEFVGPVATGPAQYRRFALQVRPTGEGRFEAVQYRGGLPGEPSYAAGPVTLLGKRSEGFLVLSGGPWAVFVEPDHCLLLDRQGQHVGRLERIVRQSPTLGAQPPKYAIVLFDGKGTSQFSKAHVTPEGLLMEGAEIRPMLQDFNLHVEFMLPYMPSAVDQARANSGVYLQSRYEIQVLDSFAQEPTFNGCASIYRFRKPDANMSLPPLTWQTYDIVFTAPRWAGDGTKLKSARVTVWHNGVKVQNDVTVEGKTGAGKPEEPMPLPTYLQDHHNPVRFRNVWMIDRGAAPAVNFPVLFQAAAAPARPTAAQRPHSAAHAGTTPAAGSPVRERPSPHAAKDAKSGHGPAK
jgi:hypothetical protein